MAGARRMCDTVANRVLDQRLQDEARYNRGRCVLIDVIHDVQTFFVTRMLDFQIQLDHLQLVFQANLGTPAVLERQPQ